MPIQNIALIVNSRNGKVVEHSQQQPLTLKAQYGATYTVLNKDTNTFPGDLILKRNGAALVIKIEQEVVARIEAFYDDNIKATFSVG